MEFHGSGSENRHVFKGNPYFSLVLSTRFILYDQHTHQNAPCPNFTISRLVYCIWPLLCTFQVLCAYNSGQNILYMKRRSKTRKFEIVSLNKFSCILQETNTILKDIYLWEEETRDVPFIYFVTLEKWKTCLKNMLSHVVPGHDLNTIR